MADPVRKKIRISLPRYAEPPEPPPRPCAVCLENRPDWSFHNMRSGEVCSFCGNKHGRRGRLVLRAEMSWDDCFMIDDAFTVVAAIQSEARDAR